MNFLLQKVIFNLTQATKNFEIVKNKFLIPVKPKKSLTGYIIFCNENRSKYTGKVTEVAKQLGAQWNAMTDEQKQVYLDKAKINSEKHAIEYNAYNERYVQPFKRVAIHNLIMKNVYVKHPEVKNVVEGARLYAEQLKTITAEEKAKLEAQLAITKAQRAKIQQVHRIPEPEITSLRSYMMRQAGERSITEFTAAERQKLTIQYEAYLQTYKLKLQQFAHRFNITLTDLEDIIKLHERREKRKEKENEQADEQILVEEPVKVAKPRTKKVPAEKVAKIPAKKEAGKRAPKTASLAQSVLSSITAEQKALQKAVKDQKKAELKVAKIQAQVQAQAQTTTTSTTSTQ